MAAKKTIAARMASEFPKLNAMPAKAGTVAIEAGHIKQIWDPDKMFAINKSLTIQQYAEFFKAGMKKPNPETLLLLTTLQGISQLGLHFKITIEGKSNILITQVLNRIITHHLK